MGLEKLKYRPLKDRPIKGKKKPKTKEPDPFWACPFCGHDLEKKDWIKKRGPWDPHETVCPCGAMEVEKACPACKCATWFKPDDPTCTNGEYRHFRKLFGCGFSGRKITRR